MKRIVHIFLVGIAPAVCAFDSAAWLAERNDNSDAERLKKAFSEYAPQVVAPAENVKFPIELYPNGLVKSRLWAEKAHLFPGTDFIWGEKVHVEQFKADGKTSDGFLLAETCFVDRKTASGWVSGEAFVDWNGSMVRGHEVYFAFKREYIKIFAGTEIVTEPLGKNGLKTLMAGGKQPVPDAKTAGRGAGKAEKTTEVAGAGAKAHITAIRTDYDRKNGVIHFENHVMLDDPEYKMHADGLFVFLEGTNALKRLVALGNVAITNGARRAYCDRATYLKSVGRITLYGNDAAKALLCETRAAKQGDGERKRAEETTLKGDKITFWHDSDQVEVERPEIEMPGKGLGGLKEAEKK